MHIAIIGNGIAGTTAARWLGKLNPDVRITLISAETEYFFSRTALMYVYTGHLRWEDLMPYEPFFWKKNRIELRHAYVERIDPAQNKLHFSKGAPLRYDQLILATGSTWNKFGWPGEDLERVRGLVSAQDLAYLEEHSKDIQAAAVVGGGLIGIEMAEMFHSRHIPVSLLVRESSYWSGVLPAEESEMVTRHIRSHGIDLRLNTELAAIHDEGTGAATHVTTTSGERIDANYVGLTAGVRPNVAFLRNVAGLEINRGILVDDYLQTSLPGVYAIGDCAEVRQPQPGRFPIEAVWYTGRIMGETVAHTALGRATPYRPGLWFNSAKFLDLEYQVYGQVPNRLPDNLSTLYWEHPAGNKSIRINYATDTGHVKGFNLMGIRYRQEVCEQWILQETPLDEVLSNLGLANFDPELYEEHEARVIQYYNGVTGKNIRLRQKRGLPAVLKFLGFGKKAPRANVRPGEQ